MNSILDRLDNCIEFFKILADSEQLENNEYDRIVDILIEIYFEDEEEIMNHMKTIVSIEEMMLSMYEFKENACSGRIGCVAE